MVSAIIFDWFGVCTTENWADCLSRELHQKLNVDEGKIRAEFKPLLQPFARAEISEDEFLERFIQALDTSQNPADFKYLFTTLPEINHPLLAFVAELKEKHKTYLLSNNFGPVFPNYERQIDFDRYFDHLFLSHKLGVGKTQDKIWDIVIREINVHPDKILFVDNKEKYLVLPKQLGVHTILFKNNEQARADIMKCIK